MKKPNNNDLSENREKKGYLHIVEHKTFFWYNENNM